MNDKFDEIVSERENMGYYDTNEDKYNLDDIKYNDGTFNVSKDPDNGKLIINDTTADAEILDEDGNIVKILPKLDTQGTQLYYTAGSYPFSTANYVPSYQDSVYLSKLTGESTTTPLDDTSSMKRGFCSEDGINIFKKDEKCQAIDKSTCASTYCCVLLGGAKCVSGNENGPILNGHYSDTAIKDRDYYYHKGMCYGNCPENGIN